MQSLRISDFDVKKILLYLQIIAVEKIQILQYYILYTDIQNTHHHKYIDKIPTALKYITIY